MEAISTATSLFIDQHIDDDPRSLALQAQKYPDVDMKLAITQIAGRQAAKSKIPSWFAHPKVLYPRHLSLEQCSSEATARYKATLAEGNKLTDLTGGFGVDCAFMAQRFVHADYVERQEELCEIARHNFEVLGEKQISVHHADGVGYLSEMNAVDWIFLDPARRDSKGGKTVVIADCEPDVSLIEPLLLDKAKSVMVKLSPMLDLSLALNTLQHVSEAHIVSVNNECKDLLLVLSKSTTPQPIKIHCINLSGSRIERFSFTRESEQDALCNYTHQLGKYLYEPNASVMKGGAFKQIAAEYGVAKLHPNSHLYTSDSYLPQFPGRVFEMMDSCGFSKKELKERLKAISKANLAVRNFPSTVAELRKRLKLSEGGDLYLFATTLNDDSRTLIFCRKPMV